MKYSICGDQLYEAIEVDGFGTKEVPVCKIAKPEANVLDEMQKDIEEMKRLERVYSNRGVIVKMNYPIQQVCKKIDMFVEQIKAGLTIGNSLDVRV